MKRLGYTRFVAQGGDWGDAVSEQMALQIPPELIGIHVNISATVPADVTKSTSIAANRRHQDFSAEERHAWDQTGLFL